MIAPAATLDRVPLRLSVPLPGPFRYTARINGRGTGRVLGPVLWWLLIGCWWLPLKWTLIALWWVTVLLGRVAVWAAWAARAAVDRRRRW